MIFFNHGSWYLISFHVMVIIFRRYSKVCGVWFYFFNNCSFENVISTVTQYNAKNSVFWSFVSWPQHSDYYGAKSFVNVTPKMLESYLLTTLYFCLQLSNMYVVENIKVCNIKTKILGRLNKYVSTNSFFLDLILLCLGLFNYKNWG